MKSMIFAAVLCAVYYAQAQAYFSETHMQQWVAEHNTKAWSGDQRVCDDFDERVQASLESEEGQMWEVNGGKTEICQYVQQATQVLAATQPRTQIDNVRIQLGGFPWLQAKLSYTEHVQLQTQHLPNAEFSSNNELLIGRTFSGLKIHSWVTKAAKPADMAS